MNALTFKLRLVQPLLIGQVGAGEENSAITFDYIAGSTIRGALIGRYMQQNGDFDLSNLPADSAEIRPLFFDGAVTYLNAYLEDKDGQRTLPTPRSWRSEKDQIALPYGTIVDAAIGSTEELEEPKAIPAHYCTASFQDIAEEDDFESRPEAILYRPAYHVGLHNASEERYLKREGDSFVFRYQALAAGQVFCGAMISTDKTLLAALKPLLALPDLFLGRSRSAGYGHVVVEEVVLTDDWQEYQVPQLNHEPDGAGLITLTLLSDAILRNSHGQYTTDLSTLPAIKTLPIEERFVAAGLTGGFNRKWGLPLPQVPVIQAGSVWTFRRSTETEAALQQLVATGIGERRVEGFGRVAVDWQRFPQIEKHQFKPNPKGSTTVTLTNRSKQLAKQMGERLYRQQLEHKLQGILAGPLTIQNAPENAQLSRLRIIARRAWHEQRPELMKHFLSTMKPLARNQYLRARIGNKNNSKSLLQWLEEGWQEKLWSDYFYQSPSTLPKLGDVQIGELDALKVEYQARLIDGLCTKAIKERRLVDTQANMVSSGEVLA